MGRSVSKCEYVIEWVMYRSHPHSLAEATPALLWTISHPRTQNESTIKTFQVSEKLFRLLHLIVSSFFFAYYSTG